MPENLHPKRVPRRSDTRTLSRFMQELSWLLNSYSDLDFKALEALSRESSSTAPLPKRRIAKSDKRQNVETLVGVLPGLFVDERLFPSNVDIVEFAATALGINILRWQKKSKFELIGHIVCTANALDDGAVSSLVSALTKVTGKNSARIQIENQRLQGLSWNEVIQNLIGLEN